MRAIEEDDIILQLEELKNAFSWYINNLGKLNRLNDDIIEFANKVLSFRDPFKNIGYLFAKYANELKQEDEKKYKKRFSLKDISNLEKAFIKALEDLGISKKDIPHKFVENFTLSIYYKI